MASKVPSKTKTSVAAAPVAKAPAPKPKAKSKAGPVVVAEPSTGPAPVAGAAVLQARSALRPSDDAVIANLERLHAEGRALYEAKDWAGAGQRFDALAAAVNAAKTQGRKKLPRVAFRYLRKSAHLQAGLAPLESRNRRMAYIRKRAWMTEPGNFYPDDAAGLVESFSTLLRNPDFAVLCDRRRLVASLRALGDALSATDASLISANEVDRIDRAVAVAVRDQFLPLKDQPRFPGLGPDQWLILSYVMVLARDLEMAHWARTHALAAALDPVLALDSDEAVRCRARALAEAGDGSGFDQLFEQHPPKAKSLRELHNFASVYIGRSFDAGARIRDDAEGFGAYLAGKSIAIVGPVNTGLDNGAEIDSFDVVVRMNYRGMSGFPPEIFGRRADVSYYVGGMFAKDGDKIQEALGDLKYAVYPPTLLPPPDPEGKGPRARGSLSSGRRNVPFFAGMPNAFQRCLLDLIRFDHGRIKLFNGNLWLDKKPTNPAYHRGGFLNFNLPFVFIHHDVVSNFLFLKRMADSGQIEVDSVIASILAMGAEGYAQEMIATHGGPR